MCSTLGHWTRLERLAMDKHSVKIRKLRPKRFYSTGPRSKSFITFLIVNCNLKQLASSNSTVLEHSHYHPKVKGLSPAAAPGIERDNDKQCFAIIRCCLGQF
jgi:hypothetical protein